MTFNNNTKSSERDFFSGEYQFTGKHGEYVKQLTDTLVEKGTYEKEIKIFAFNHKIYTVAPMIGYLYISDRKRLEEILKFIEVE